MYWPQANNCSMVCFFHKPLDVFECQGRWPLHHHHHHPSQSLDHAEGRAITLNSNLRMPMCLWCYPTPKSQGWKKPLQPIDGLTRQISALTVGQQLKVTGRNHSARASHVGEILMSLFEKVSPLGIFKEAAIISPLFIEKKYIYNFF